MTPSSWTARCRTSTATRRPPGSAPASRRSPHADRRDDRARLRGRPRALPACRHGRLPQQAAARRGSRSGAGALARPPRRAPAGGAARRRRAGAQRPRREPQLAGRLLEVFARTTPPLLDELRAAVERGEEETARKLAHKLRSSTETVGAQRLAELARQVELGEDAEAAVAALDPVYRGTLDELSSWPHRRGGSASTARMAVRPLRAQRRTAGSERERGHEHRPAGSRAPPRRRSTPRSAPDRHPERAATSATEPVVRAHARERLVRARGAAASTPRPRCRASSPSPREHAPAAISRPARPRPATRAGARTGAKLARRRAPAGAAGRRAARSALPISAPTPMRRGRSPTRRRPPSSRSASTGPSTAQAPQSRFPTDARRPRTPTPTSATEDVPALAQVDEEETPSRALDGRAGAGRQEAAR